MEYPLHAFMFRNKESFYGEELAAPRPTPKLEDHPLSSFRNAYSIYSHLPSLLEAVPPSATWGRAIQFGISVKLVRLIKMCLIEIFSGVQVGKHLSDVFPIKNGLKQGDA